MKMNGGCTAIGVGEVYQWEATVAEVEVDEATNAKALATPVYIVQRLLPGTECKTMMSEK